ncbi:MAG: DUF2715 domain-containing protein [Bacteroidales bacterium]|nr:DUF2715 domain-containing protein [Bacteroidales bacterium]
MKIKLFVVSICLLMATGIHAQVKNLGVGGNFMGSSTINISGSDDKALLYESSFRPLIGGSIFYEAILGGMTHMWEASYMMGKMESLKSGDKFITEWGNNPAIESLKMASLFYYAGMTFNSGNRLQIPVYLGFGGNYNMADPIKCLTFNIAAKARVKFYFTDTVGVYAGAGWKGGMGNQKVGDGAKFSVTQRGVNLEAGLTISL